MNTKQEIIRFGELIDIAIIMYLLWFLTIKSLEIANTETQLIIAGIVLFTIGLPYFYEGVDQKIMKIKDPLSIRIYKKIKTSKNLHSRTVQIRNFGSPLLNFK